MSLTLYRRCKLGETLIESLDDLRRQNKITDALGDKIMEKFDKVISVLLKFKYYKDYVRRNPQKTKV